MSTETAALAVFLRRTQWLLDDLAFRVGAGHLDAGDIDTTTAALEEVVHLLRETRPTTIDQPERTIPCPQPGPRSPACCPSSSA